MEDAPEKPFSFVVTPRLISGGGGGHVIGDIAA